MPLQLIQESLSLSWLCWLDQKRSQVIQENSPKTYFEGQTPVFVGLIDCSFLNGKGVCWSERDILVAAILTWGGGGRANTTQTMIDTDNVHYKH